MQVALAESPDEKAIHDVLDAEIDALFNAHFSQAASLLHPQTQHLFRDILSARFDELLRQHSLTQISLVSGLPAHPMDLRLSDAEFFVFACEQMQARHPDFVGDRTILPFDIRESVFYGNDRVAVTLSYSRSVRTERTAFSYCRPFVIVLGREKSNWQMLSCPFAETIARNWSHDLAGLGQSAR
jgi:hypothetical protein